MKKVAVILSGCGSQDGSEIHEAVLTLLALDQAGLAYQCLAPDIKQLRVVNHLTGDTTPETRQVLIEAARIARGNIQALEKANAADYDAAILPGGFGAALNLSDFALKGAECSVLPSVKQFVQALAKGNKPVGFICIAPSMISKIYGPGVKHTLGNHPDRVNDIEKMGGKHESCNADACIIDDKHKVVSTPAYLVSKSIKEIAIGIEKLVLAVQNLM